MTSTGIAHVKAVNDKFAIGLSLPVHVPEPGLLGLDMKVRVGRWRTIESIPIELPPKEPT